MEFGLRKKLLKAANELSSIGMGYHVKMDKTADSLEVRCYRGDEVFMGKAIVRGKWIQRLEIYDGTDTFFRHYLTSYNLSR